MGVFSLLCVWLFVCLWFSQRQKKDRGVKFCMPVQLLSGMSFSQFGELWLVESHGGGITPGMYVSDALEPRDSSRRGLVGIRNWVLWLDGQSELGW